MTIRTLSAKWTVNLQQDDPTYGEWLVEELATQLKEEIDWEVFSSQLQEMGWVKVTLTNNKNWAIYDWVSQNCKGKHENRNNDWIFELKEEAEWFTLRWS